MKKALVLALLGAVVAGCGVSPTTRAPQVGTASSKAAPVAALSTALSNQQISALQAKVKAATKTQPSWKKKVSERALSDKERSGGYQETMQALFAEAAKANGGGMLEFSADSMSPALKGGSGASFNALFAPSGNFKGFVEVTAAEGKLTTYQWGFLQTMQTIAMKQAMGEPMMDIKSPEGIASLTDLLSKAKMFPMPANITSANAYLNMMPRRKPDLSVEWFPAYIVVTYEGHYAQGKMLANALTGEVIAPKQ